MLPVPELAETITPAQVVSLAEEMERSVRCRVCVCVRTCVCVCVCVCVYVCAVPHGLASLV